MDEASSRFVDRLVLERLINEKLSKVRHRTTPSAISTPPRPISSEELGPVVFSRTSGDKAFLIRSPLAQRSPENEWFRVAVHEVASARGALILVHGLFEDNRALYQFLIDELNRQRYSVYVTTLPYHYERVPPESRFSGEFFLSADLQRTVEAFQSAEVELELCQDWLRKQVTCPVFTLGFSMGAAVALSLAAERSQSSGIVAINPAAGISSAIWTSPLCEPIRRDLAASGLDEPSVSRYLAPLCSLSNGFAPGVAKRILMVRAIYDQVTQQSQYDLVARSLPPENVLMYKAGHLNTLRVPRLASDIVNFCESLSSCSRAPSTPTDSLSD